VTPLKPHVSEDRRIRLLPESDPARALLLTPLVAGEVSEAHGRLAAILGDRVSTRADLSREIALRDDVLDEAAATISAVRNHLLPQMGCRASLVRIWGPGAERTCGT
jgi:hypothetical protein